MIDEALEIAVDLAEHFEGFKSLPYLCPAGVPTIGFGFTHYLDGAAVTLGDAPMTRADAAVLLRHMMQTKYMPQTIRLCPDIGAAGRLGAITDFCFNLGAGALRASTLRKRILTDDWDAVPAELRKWTRGGGRVLRGLVLRREAEIELLQY